MDKQGHNQMITQFHSTTNCCGNTKAPLLRRRLATESFLATRTKPTIAKRTRPFKGGSLKADIPLFPRWGGFHGLLLPRPADHSIAAQRRIWKVRDLGGVASALVLRRVVQLLRGKLRPLKTHQTPTVVNITQCRLCSNYEPRTYLPPLPPPSLR